MASHTSGAILFSFASVFCCLELLEAITKIVQTSESDLTRLAATAFLPAVAVTFGLTLLLLFSFIANAGGAGLSGRRFLGRLTRVTLLMATAAFIAGAALSLVASGYLGGADNGVRWLHTKK